MTGGYIPWAMALALLLLWQPTGAEADQCRMTSPCFFDCGDKVMDMTALKTVRFQDVMDSKGQNKFSYSPCASFSEGHGCRNTHVCQVDILDRNKTINVGSSVSVSLSPSGKHSYFTYSHRAKGVNRTTTVTVLCGSVNEAADPKLIVTGEVPAGSGKFRMSLTSSHACFQAKPSTTPARTTPAKPNVTTEVTTHKHVTTAHTTPSKHNVTTEPRNATTHVTTPAGHNVTTASRNVTTHVTTPASNVTTVVTTPASNVTTVVTTPASNVTTVVTTHVTGNVTTAHLTTAGRNGTTPGDQTTQGYMTTTHNGADDLSRFSAQRVMVILLMAMVTALVSL